MKCRSCGAGVDVKVIDLGTAPPSNAYLTAEALHGPERWYPLRVGACSQCWLVQAEDFTRADELFDGDYAYFSAYSTSWLAHCERYVSAIAERLHLGAHSHVVEIAANDGYLLQYVAARGIPCLGVEPTASTAAAARARGIEIVEEFFGRALAARLLQQGRSADLMVANNVLAHVPDINDFVAGFTQLLKPTGVATFEFPHLLQLMRHCQFDTIYHEHFSYLSLAAVLRVFERHGLAVFDVEEMPTHGGSLRVYAQRADSGRQPISPCVGEVLMSERLAGLEDASTYFGFQARAQRVRDDLLRFLLEARRAGKNVAAYGAAAKGNTLLNFAGIRADQIPYVVDLNPAKQGKFLPGSRIPIVAESVLREQRPDYILLLPWNLRDELVEQLAYVREWGAQFVTAVPQLLIT